MPTSIRMFKRNFSAINHCYNFRTPINHMYCIPMPPIMCILASFANWLIMTKILGELHIFQAHSQQKTGVGVQLKKKLMLYRKVYSLLQPQSARTISYQRNEESKTGQMGNAASRV